MQHKKNPNKSFALFHFSKVIYAAFLKVVLSGRKACVHATKWLNLFNVQEKCWYILYFIAQKENENKRKGCTYNPIYLYGVFWRDKIDEIKCQCVQRYSTFNNFVNIKNSNIVGMHLSTFIGSTQLIKSVKNVKD